MVEEDPKRTPSYGTLKEQQTALDDPNAGFEVYPVQATDEDSGRGSSNSLTPSQKSATNSQGPNEARA